MENKDKEEYDLMDLKSHTTVFPQFSPLQKRKKDQNHPFKNQKVVMFTTIDIQENIYKQQVNSFNSN